MLRESISNEWFTILVVLGLVLVTISKLLFAKRFEDFIQVVGNSKYLKIYEREQKFIDGFDALLFANLVISTSIFLYISYSVVEEPLAFDLLIFLKLLFSVTSLFLIKILLERLIGSLFEIDKLIDSYVFQKTSYKNFIGFVLLPINIVLIYALTPSKIIVFIIFGLIFLLNLIGFITSFKNYQKLLTRNLFYFILYLCALEIGPYLILYKLFTDY